MSAIRIIETGDGSHSLYNEELRETYHSTHGALRESKHVFISMGLDYFQEKYHAKEISVFEMGFGTGLNAILAFDWAKKNSITLNYDSIEAFPISYEIAARLNYFDDDSALKSALLELHQADWDKEYSFPHYKFQKIKSKIEEYPLRESAYDVVFFDAFAPSKQEEVWSLEILSMFINALKPNGVLVTYCAKGQLKRDLKTLGCEVESIPGPPGKKEMTRATKIHAPHLE